MNISIVWTLLINYYQKKNNNNNNNARVQERSFEEHANLLKSETGEMLPGSSRELYL
jgi:hypothetical protein